MDCLIYHQVGIKGGLSEMPCHISLHQYCYITAYECDNYALLAASDIVFVS